LKGGVFLLTLYKNIKKMRLERGMSQDTLAKLTGYTDRSSIAKIEKGLVDLQQSKIELFAKALGTSSRELVGWSNDNSPSSIIPVLEKIPSGMPIETITDIVDYEEIDTETAANGDYFALKIKGDSMEPRICEGDIVIVRRQDDVDSGEVAIVTVNGNDATIKRLVKYADGIRLVPYNPSYEPIYFTNNEVTEKPVKIIGKVVENRQRY
jgi:repressor LexA